MTSPSANLPRAVRRAHLASSVSRDLVVQRPKGAIQDARIELPMIDRLRLAIEAEQSVDRRLRRADRVFDREHHIFGLLAELTDEREISRSLRDHLESIAAFARQELAGDERHHARDADRVFEDVGDFLADAEMAEHLGHDLPARAGGHRLLHEIAGLVDEEAVAPQDADVFGLPDWVFEGLAFVLKTKQIF